MILASSLERSVVRVISFYYCFFFFSILQQFNVSVGIRTSSEERVDILIRQFACTSIARIIQECRVSRYVFLLPISRWIDLGSGARRRMRENKMRFIKRYMLQGSDNDKIPWFDLVHPAAGSLSMKLEEEGRFVSVK